MPPHADFNTKKMCSSDAMSEHRKIVFCLVPYQNSLELWRTDTAVRFSCTFTLLFYYSFLLFHFHLPKQSSWLLRPFRLCPLRKHCPIELCRVILEKRAWVKQSSGWKLSPSHHNCQNGWRCLGGSPWSRRFRLSPALTTRAHATNISRFPCRCKHSERSYLSCFFPIHTFGRLSGPCRFAGLRGIYVALFLAAIFGSCEQVSHGHMTYRYWCNRRRNLKRDQPREGIIQYWPCTSLCEGRSIFYFMVFLGVKNCGQIHVNYMRLSERLVTKFKQIDIRSIGRYVVLLIEARTLFREGRLRRLWGMS